MSKNATVLNYVQHVQHDYFSSFNQSDHCFAALSLPLLSSLLKLPNLNFMEQRLGGSESYGTDM